MAWLYTHDNPFYPKDNRPHLWAWDVETGKVVWEKDFSEYGFGGNDTGLCAMDGKLYYSNFFGYSASMRKARGTARGSQRRHDVPRSGDRRDRLEDDGVLRDRRAARLTGKNGRLYMGGWNQPDESTKDRYVFCISAKDGSLIWKSDPWSRR
jgi:outer membrane protein assembly factor BamB